MKYIMLLVWPVILLLACEKQDDNIELALRSSCDQEAIVDQDLFDSATSSHVTIEETEIDGNCLRIKFSASGCNGGTWKLRLVAAEQVKYSLPPQRDVRLKLENNELCQAHLTRELTFDISDLRSNGEFTLLNVINSEQQLRYNH